MLPGEGVLVVVVVVDVVAGRVVLGTVTVTVLVGAGVEVVLVFDFEPVVDFVGLVPVAGGRNAAYTTVAPGAE